MTATPKLGLVCISELLKDKDKKIAFKTMTRKQFLSMQRQDAIKELSFRILHNSKRPPWIKRLSKKNQEQNISTRDE
jgi:UV DNA damage repair endonuclease